MYFWDLHFFDFCNVWKVFFLNFFLVDFVFVFEFFFFLWRFPLVFTCIFLDFHVANFPDVSRFFPEGFFAIFCVG